MSDRIRHHLGRARAGNLAKIADQPTLVQLHLDDIASVLTRIHADRRVTLHCHVEADLAVLCEGQDLDEMLGNLLDNAFKWARTRIDIDARRQEGTVVISVWDDGPGLSADRLEAALTPGVRLDQTVPGDGFGLSIAQELAELYGGSLDFQASDTNGLRVNLTLSGSKFF
jgi:signal transduction histidine kinase